MVIKCPTYNFVLFSIGQTLLYWCSYSIDNITILNYVWLSSWILTLFFVLRCSCFTMTDGSRLKKSFPLHNEEFLYSNLSDTRPNLILKSDPKILIFLIILIFFKSAPLFPLYLYVDDFKTKKCLQTVKVKHISLSLLTWVPQRCLLNIISDERCIRGPFI